MTEGAIERLTHLSCDVRVRVVGQAVVVSALIGKLRLNKERFALYRARSKCGRDGGTNTRFNIMFALVRSVDGAKSTFDRFEGKLLRSLLFPGRAVHN